MHCKMRYFLLSSQDKRVPHPMVILLSAKNNRLQFISEVPNLDNLDILKRPDV